MPTEAEITESFGVSRITVRRALHELRIAGVVVTARGRRTQVLRAVPEPAPPSGDALGGLRVVTVSVPWLANDNIQALMSGVEDELRGRGCTAVITSSDNDPGRERRQVLLAMQLGVAGLIVYPAQGSANALLFREVAAARLPMVYVGRHYADVTADRVVGDNVGGATAAVDFLLRRGHRRIAFINGREREVSAITERLQGYCAAHERHGLAVDFRLVQLDLLTREVLESEASERIADLWTEVGPTAALAVNVGAASTFRWHLRALRLDCEIAAFTALGRWNPRRGWWWLCRYRRRPWDGRRGPSWRGGSAATGRTGRCTASYRWNCVRPAPIR